MASSNNIKLDRRGDFLKRRKGEVKKSLFQLWLSWYMLGLDIGEKRVEYLIEAKLLTGQLYNDGKLRREVRDLKYRRQFHTKHEGEIKADENVSIIREFNTEEQRLDDKILSTTIVELKNVVENADKHRFDYYGITRKIVHSDWYIPREQIGNFAPEFIAWIDSINRGWNHRINYRGFELYKLQAQQWLDERLSFSPLESEDKRSKFLREERQKMLENSLYALNKYLIIREGEAASGSLKYTAWECQAVILYLFDNGLSVAIGKPRQIGFSTVINAAAMVRTMYRKNFFTKFVTEKGTKGAEIYEDKARSILDEWPAYLKPSVSHDSKAGGTPTIRFSRKIDKGDTGGTNSRFVVEAPYTTVINGGSPNLTLIDEAGNIAIISEMIDQGRVTLFWLNPTTGRLEIKRQLIAWGTGGDMSKKVGHAYEAFFKKCLEAWRKRNFNYFIIPIFLNAYAKPGVTKEFYEKEKEVAYSGSGPEAKKTRVVFHQTYPITIDDMFLADVDTLIEIGEINGHIDRCENLRKKPMHGYFEPIYDLNEKYDEFSDIPYRPVGARFVPVSDNEILLNPNAAPVTIFDEPELNWSDRYYHGVDPIFTSTGLSKFAAGIWDAARHRVSARVNFRESDYKYCYLQGLLLQLHYSKPRDIIPSLVEYNAGTGYIDYVTAKGYLTTLLSNYFLPLHLQTSTLDVGIRKGQNSKFLVHKLEEILKLHAQNIDSVTFWYQIKTFVRKVTNAGNEKYEPLNKLYNNDDELDAVLYAYINAESNSMRSPRQLDIQETKGYTIKTVRQYDERFNIVTKRVKVYNQ